jgi:hypothetical protein
VNSDPSRVESSRVSHLGTRTPTPNDDVSIVCHCFFFNFLACALCFFPAKKKTMDHQQECHPQQEHKECLSHTIVVVAKCPIPGKSKTRLIPLLGPEGSAQLAQAMLADVLSTLSECVSTCRTWNQSQPSL